MNNPKYFGRKLFQGLLCAIALSGCATTRHISSPTTPTVVGLVNTNTDAEVRLHYVIVPGGPGSWVEGASWNEFVIEIKNRAGSDLRISDVNLIDSQGVYVQAKHPTGWELATTSDHAAKQLGRQAASAVAGAAIMYIPGIASVLGVGLPGLISQNALAATPFASHYLEQKDKKAIENEFSRRKLPVPVGLIRGGSVTGSVFFPVVHQPQSLVVSFSTAKGNTQVMVPLTAPTNGSGDTDGRSVY